MKNLLSITILLLLIVQIACKKEKSRSVYEGCCGTTPTADSFLIDTTAFPPDVLDLIPRYGTVYIPNIFIPDTSGFAFNSIFMVFGGEGTQLVISEVFSSEEGEIFLSRDSFLCNDISSGWNGLRSNGTFHHGPFNYEVKVKFIDGRTKTYTGKACSYKCSDQDFPNERLPDCFFPAQNNGNGAPDQNQSPGYDQGCFD